MKKTNITTLLLFLILLTGFFSLAQITHAASTNYQYTFLEGLPGFYGRGTANSDLPGLILSIYKFGIWTVGIAGLFMITIGGIMYMGSAGNTSSAKNAKDIINDSLIGIAAAMLAYLFLYVINPDLTNIDLSNFVAVNVQSPDVAAGEYVPLPGQLSDSQAKSMLSSAEISVKNNICSYSGQTNCTTLEGIPRKAVNGLINMKKACPSCDFYVTGGTESGHKSHGPGNPMIDVRYSTAVRNFLANLKANKQYEQYGISQICTGSADLTTVSYGRSYASTCQDPSSDAHFHLAFGL